MSKVIYKPKKSNCKSEGAERITIQLRSYDSRGKYDKTKKVRNTTIHFKDCTVEEAFEILKSSISNSRLVDERIIVVDE